MNNEELIIKHLDFAKKVARKYAYKIRGDPAIELADLEQESLYGLCKAAEKYNPARGKFETFAFWWCRRYILRLNKPRPRFDVDEGVDEDETLTFDIAEARLTPREREVFTHLFNEGLNCAETAKKMKITHQRVSQLKISGLKKIKKKIAA